MTETKTLQMTFLNAGGGKVTINVADPKDDLDESTVENAMADIVLQNVITTKGGDLIGAVSARVITRQVVDIFS